MTFAGLGVKSRTMAAAASQNDRGYGDDGAVAAGEGDDDDEEDDMIYGTEEDRLRAFRLAAAAVPSVPGLSKPLYRENTNEIDKGEALMLGMVTNRGSNVRSVAVGKDFHCVLTEEGTVQDVGFGEEEEWGKTLRLD